MKRACETKTPRKPVVPLKSGQKHQPVNPNHWSEDSKRSVTFQIPPSEYEDIHYQCARCDHAAVFTAVEQKLTFEGRKAYIWQRRKLCSKCWSERQQIQHNIRKCQAQWRTQKRELKRDAEFLKHWLELLEVYPAYGGRKNLAGITMLRRLVEASLKKS